MKKFKDLANNSSIVCAYLDTNIPTKKFDDIVESVVSVSQKLNSPSVIFVRPNERLRMPLWMSQIYEGVTFCETEFDNALDVANTLTESYANVVVVDYEKKAPLFEGFDFVGVEQKVVLSEQTAHKSFATFSKEFEESLNESDCRKLYTAINPPIKYKDVMSKIDETRELFYKGEIFGVGTIVEDKNHNLYEILDRGSNYLMVVDQTGNTYRKFPNDLQESNQEFQGNTGYFKGYTPGDAFMNSTEITEAFGATISDYNAGNVTDAFAILKSIKMVNSLLMGENVDIGQIQFSLNKINQLHNHRYLNEMADKSIATQLQAAKIIAGAVGASTSGNNPTDMVNNAIRYAKKSANPTQMKILANMLQTASKVGVTYDKTLLESVDDQMLAVHRHQKLLKEKPTSEVLSAHKDMRKIGVEYSAKDVGGKRAMIKDILAHNHGPRTVSSYKSLAAKIRKSMDEETQIDEVSDDTLKSYTQKAMRDTIGGKKDRNAGMSKAYSRLSGTNKPLLDKKKVEEATAYGRDRSTEHDFAMHGSTKVPSYKLVDKRTRKIVSTHSSATDAVAARNKIRGTMDTHSIVKEGINEVHLDPDYQEEIGILGYNGLKKKLAQMTGIENYGEQEPGKEIDLVDKDGVIVKDAHTKPGFSLQSSNETHRKMKVRKLKDG